MRGDCNRWVGVDFAEGIGLDLRRRRQWHGNARTGVSNRTKCHRTRFNRRRFSAVCIEHVDM